MKVGYMRFLAAALSAVSLVVPAISIAQEMDLNSAINKSGRQRMLSQRMTKAYCRIGLNIRRDEAEKQLSDAIPLFERQLADLKAFSPSGPINAALANVEAKWTPFKQVVTKPYNRDGVARLLDLNEELLQATERVVRLYEEQSGKDIGRLLDISGRQRMLSQRMTKAYYQIGLNIRRDEAEKQLSDAIPLFERQLADLKAFSPSPGPINAALANVEAKWTPFKQIVTKPYNRDGVARLLDLNEELLQATERVVRLYEEQ